jgi:hypothetical protein
MPSISDSTTNTTEHTLEDDVNNVETTIMVDILQQEGDKNSGASQFDLLETPKKMNVVQPQEVLKFLAQSDAADEWNTTLGTNDVVGILENVAWMANDETSGFCRVHYRIFESVTTWVQYTNAKQPFYLKWNKAVPEGLTALSKWDRVAKIFKLGSLRDYIMSVYKCPCIQERY